MKIWIFTSLSSFSSGILLIFVFKAELIELVIIVGIHPSIHSANIYQTSTMCKVLPYNVKESDVLTYANSIKKRSQVYFGQRGKGKAEYKYIKELLSNINIHSL